MLETIYAMERIMVEYENEPMLKEVTFVLKNERNPTSPNFRVWNSLGPLYTYTHDDLMKHRDWIVVDARNHFHWHGVYLDILPPHVRIQTRHPSEIGMQTVHEPMEEDSNENENGEEEEEDPKKDPNRVDEEENRIPQPIMIEEDLNREPNPPNMDFNQDLEIPDGGGVEDKNELDPNIWRDIHEISELPRVTSGIANNLLETETEEEEVMLREARAIVDRI